MLETCNFQEGLVGGRLRGDGAVLRGTGLMGCKGAPGLENL